MAWEKTLTEHFLPWYRLELLEHWERRKWPKYMYGTGTETRVPDARENKIQSYPKNLYQEEYR